MIQQTENIQNTNSGESKEKKKFEVNKSLYKKKIFSNKFKNSKRRISNKKLKEKEDRKQKRKIKRKFILPESLPIDGYKKASNLSLFITKYGKIERRKANRLEGKKYRKISRSIKNMRILGFIPFLKK